MYLQTSFMHETEYSHTYANIGAKLQRIAFHRHMHTLAFYLLNQNWCLCQPLVVQVHLSSSASSRAGQWRVLSESGGKNELSSKPAVALSLTLFLVYTSKQIHIHTDIDYALSTLVPGPPSMIWVPNKWSNLETALDSHLYTAAVLETSASPNVKMWKDKKIS